MRFGIMTFCRAPFADVVRLVRTAEELGFDSAWVDDDILTPDYVDFEAWTLLAALARETSRIRLGTLVSVPPFRHPSLLAAQVITVDHASNGRAELGLGAGGPPNNYAAFGHEVWSPEERAERLDEQAAILSTLLRGEPVDFTGQHYRVQEARLSAAVQQPRPPFIIAAHGARGLRTAARYADGWNSLGGQPYRIAQDPARRIPLADAVENTRRLSEQLDGYCVEEGRDPATIRRSALVYRPRVDPLSSLDAFDEHVGHYAEIGIDELVFYWPPLDNLFPRQVGSAAGEPTFQPPVPVSRDQERVLEQIATERIRGR